MFDPSAIPLSTGQLLVVTDKIAAPADFVIVNILNSRLKASTQRRCVFVSFSQGFTHWSSICSRSVRSQSFNQVNLTFKEYPFQSPATNLNNAIADTSLTFVDAHAEVLTKSLKTVYTKISKALEPVNMLSANNPTTVIIDGLSQAEWTGLPIAEVKRFVRAANALCTRV